MVDKQRPNRHVLGGMARAKALTPSQRSESARKAAVSRWSSDMPQATHEGVVAIGNVEIIAAVLPNGERVLSQGTFLQALGRSRSAKAGTGGLTTVDGLPSFLLADQLKAFISDELRVSTTPIHFRARSGQRSVGYKAELLPMVCEVYLKFRDSLAEDGKTVPPQYRHIVQACDVVTRGLARVGIVALVDEATGYQEVRDRLALQKILERFLSKELAAWAKRFPDEFYMQIFRLRHWTWKGMSINRPSVVAHYTKDIVYARLTPGLLKELEARNPADEKGNRKARHHQWLSDDIGHPALRQHLFAVTALMRACGTWEEFQHLLNKAFPRRGDTLTLDY